MRSHGWSGNTPASDEEAIARILDAAEQIVAERGPAMKIADVARRLGVTRQTVYRYFPSTEALMLTSAVRSADGFLDQLAGRAQGLTDPVDALVEGMAFAIEELTDDSPIGLVLGQRNTSSRPSLSSDTALTFGRQLLRRFDVDWDAYGYAESDLDELAEFGIRTLHSFLLDPGAPPRRGAELRRYLSRWVGPAVAQPRSPVAKRGRATAS